MGKSIFKFRRVLMLCSIALISLLFFAITGLHTAQAQTQTFSATPASGNGGYMQGSVKSTVSAYGKNKVTVQFSVALFPSSYTKYRYNGTDYTFTQIKNGIDCNTINPCPAVCGSIDGNFTTMSSAHMTVSFDVYFYYNSQLIKTVQSLNVDGNLGPGAEFKWETAPGDYDKSKLRIEVKNFKCIDDFVESTIKGYLNLPKSGTNNKNQTASTSTASVYESSTSGSSAGSASSSGAGNTGGSSSASVSSSSSSGSQGLTGYVPTPSTAKSSSSTSNSTASQKTRQEQILAEQQEMMRKQRAEQDRRAADLKAANIAASNAKLAQSQRNLNQATENFTNAVGGIMQARAAERAAREARLEREREERAERQRIEREAEAERLRLEAEHLDYITGMRLSLIKEFEDGRLPLSSDKINGSEVWYFAWRGDPAKTVYVTGVFPVARYGDGSFPYKNTVLKELDAAGGAGKIKIVGWFATRDYAQQVLNIFLTIAQNGEVNVKNITYKGKPQSTGNAAASADFWETGNAAKKQPDKTDSAKTVKDDYWK
jgi:hypothetical protein